MKNTGYSLFLTVLFVCLLLSLSPSEAAVPKNTDIGRTVDVDRRLVPDGTRTEIRSDDVRFSKPLADQKVRLTYWKADAEALSARTFGDFKYRMRTDTGGNIQKVASHGGLCYIEMPMVVGNFWIESKDVALAGSLSDRTVVIGADSQFPLFTVKAGMRLSLSGMTLTMSESSDVPMIVVEPGGELILKNVAFEPTRYGVRGGAWTKFYFSDVVFRTVDYPFNIDSGIAYVKRTTITDPLITVLSKGDDAKETLFLSFENTVWYDTFGKNAQGRVWTHFDGSGLKERSFIEYSSDFNTRYWMDFDWDSFRSLASSGLRWFDRNDSMGKSEFTSLRNSVKERLEKFGVRESKMLTSEEKKKLEEDFSRRDAMDFYRNEEIIGGIGTRLLTAYLLDPLFSMGTDLFSERSEAWWKGIGDEFDKAIGKDSLLYDIIVPGIVEWGFYPPFLEMTENQFRIDGKSVAFLCASYSPGNAWDILKTRLKKYQAWLDGMQKFKETPAGYAIWLRLYDMMLEIDRYVRFVYFDVPLTAALFSSMAGWTLFDPNLETTKYSDIRKLASVIVSGYLELVEKGLTVSELVDTLSLQFLELQGVETIRSAGFEKTLASIDTMREQNLSKDTASSEALRDMRRKERMKIALERKRKEINDRRTGLASGDRVLEPVKPVVKPEGGTFIERKKKEK